MKKVFLAFFLVVIGFSAFAQSSFYEFTVKDIDGNDYSLSQLKGKKVMVVNTASKCGLTPQYEDLEKLYRQFSNQNFVIIGFPANNFMKQEPGTDEEIKDFCQKNYGVTFPVMSKISVKGEDIHPLYKWLTTKELNGYEDSDVKWNFQKYLIDENGNLIGIVDPKNKPDTKEVMDWLTE
jgi:glutathione peroxidase